MTPEDYLEQRLLCRPITAYEVCVLRGNATLTGAYSRLVRVGGHRLILLDSERVRVNWAASGIAIRAPAALVRDSFAPSGLDIDTSAEVVVIAPGGTFIDAWPRGAVPQVEIVCGSVMDQSRGPALELAAGRDGVVVFVHWREIAD